MFTIKTGAEFISDIRNLSPELKNARLGGVEIERNEGRIHFKFICDEYVSDEIKKKMLAEAEKITPPAFGIVDVSVKKIVGNVGLINAEIFKYMTENYQSVSIFLKPTDIISAPSGGVFKYTIRLPKACAADMRGCGAIKKLDAYLGRNFCADFIGGVEEKEADESADLLSDEVYESELRRIEYRTIKVKDVLTIDDPDMGDDALYIEDMKDGRSVVCGTVTEITERETKNGKPFFIIHIDDTTGKTSGVYFTKKNTYSKIKEIAAGDAIIARVETGDYNGRKSTVFEKINRCTFPADFVKRDRFKRTAPAEYKLIFPTPASTIKIKSVFEENESVPAELSENVYVVFDIETTGLDVMTNGITEIGAVKIAGGAMKEQFTTLVKPDYHISEQIYELTGIDDEMVKDAPKISAVIPDFMKFIDGAVIVAHNAEFDVKFMKRFAGAEDYEIKNKVMDTMEMGRALLPQLKRHDLHTLADHFGIVFRHHRALSDAYATAELFIELMKMKHAK